MKVILLLFLLCNISLASIKIEILYNDIKISNFNIGYIHDNSNLLSIDEIIKLPFENITNQNSFGINHDITWYKLEISNSSNLDKTIYLHNNLAYMSKEIDIFEFRNNQIVDQNKYKLFDDDISRKLTGSTLVYPIELASNCTKTIYIKNHALAHQLINLKIYDAYYSTQALINKNFYSIILVAVLFAFALYNTMLFFLSRRREFAYYSLYLTNASIGLFYMYGIVFHHINIYGMQAYWINVTAIMVSLFLSLFVKSIFDTHKVNKGVNLILNSIIYFALINLFIAIFIDLFLAIKMLSFLFTYTFVILLYVGIYFYKKGHPLAKVFLLANIAYIFGLGGTIITLMGYIPYNSFTLYASGIGLMIEALLFSYLLYFRIKFLEQEITKHQNILLLKKNLLIYLKV